MPTSRTDHSFTSASAASDAHARPYCRHRRCRTATITDLVLMGLAMQRPDLLRRADQVLADKRLLMKCREYRPFKGPMVVRRVA